MSFIEVDLADSSSITQSVAAVDAGLWASNSQQIVSYAQGKGFTVYEYGSAPAPGGADRNVYTMQDATVWIDFVSNNATDDTATANLQWQQLPDGEDVNIVPGFEYAAVALVKTNHQPSEVRSAITSRGLTIIDLMDPSPQPSWASASPSGYRYIRTIVNASKPGGVLPWSAPWPISAIDSSSLVRVWAAPSGGGKGAPPPAPSSSGVGVIVGVLAAAAAAAAGGYWWLRKRRKRP